MTNGIEMKLEDIENFIDELDKERKALFDQTKINLQFVNNINSLKKEKGMTSEDIADKSRLDLKNVRNLEIYSKNPSLVDAIGYLYALDFDINDLFKVDFKLLVNFMELMSSSLRGKQYLFYQGNGKWTIRGEDKEITFKEALEWLEDEMTSTIEALDKHTDTI